MGIVPGVGVAGKSAVQWEAMVVQQVWEWWFLTFDLPFLHPTHCGVHRRFTSKHHPPSTLHPRALCDPALLLFAHPWTPPS